MLSFRISSGVFVNPMVRFSPSTFCLQAAAESKGSLERLLYVAVYTVSAYSLHPLDRTDMLMEMLLHETYECIDEARGFRYMCEAVRSA